MATSINGDLDTLLRRFANYSGQGDSCFTLRAQNSATAASVPGCEIRILKNVVEIHGESCGDISACVEKDV
jgi:hypothetical protein